MNRTTAFTLLALASLLLGAIIVQQGNSASPQTIFVNPDGSINPFSAPIQRSGETLTLTRNISNPIVIEQDNIVFDGAGYTLQGSGKGVAFNLTCSNVTIQNVKLVNWQAGILGVFDNNTIKDSWIAHCESAFKIYAQHYVILGNDIEQNNEGIRIGQGGLHLIANNTIANNGDALSLYDSGNVIVDNNFVNCSFEAIYLDSSGWSQTVYHNNFVNNQKDLVDYSNGLGKPVVASLSPWDSGSSGNYWSSYPGSDLNGDDVGDAPYLIPSTGLVDRYPLMSTLNVNQASYEILPATAPKVAPHSNSTDNDQAIALSFLKNVIQLDLNKYTIDLGYGTLRTSNPGLPTDYLGYGLWHWDIGLTTANASFTISNNTVTAFSLQPTGGPLFSKFKISNSFDTAQKIMQNYQNWTNDPEVTKMISLLNLAGSEKNITTQSGNIDLKIVVAPLSTTFSWSYIYNGVEYSSVNLTMSNFGFSAVTFMDNLGLYNIGNTDIDISQQQATTTAENFAQNYGYAVNFGNGTIITIKDLNINQTNIQANLSTTTRDSDTLYPYWKVQVPLDHTYPGETYAVTVDVWADTGVVFSAQRQIVPVASSTPQYSLSPAELIQTFEIILATGTLVLAAIVVVLVLVLRSDRKKKSPSTIA
jgi:parallel beta-helix repeat protein